MKNEIKIKSDDFMCRCDEDGARRCDAVLQLVREEFSGQDFSDFELIDALLYRLSNVGRFGIDSDQWAAVVLTLMNWDPDQKRLVAGERAYIQCDSIVDGIAALYLWAKENVKDFE